jgi:hypothetical protein
MLADITAGRPVFGYSCDPTSVCYFSGILPGDAIRATLRRLEIPPSTFTFLSAIDDNIPLDADELLERCMRRAPSTKLLVIDPVVGLAADRGLNDYRVVSKLMQQLTKLAQAHSIALIGTGGSAKSKEGQGYKSPRERFIGSVAWPEGAATMVLLEPANQANPADPRRTLMLLPRNSPPEILEHRFNDTGYLVSMSDGLGDYVLDEWLKTQPQGTEVITATVEAVALAGGISRRNCFYWITRMLDHNYLVKVRRGVYAVSKPS